MQSTSSEAQVTQAGQAIAINAMTCSQLFQLFSPMFGPDGTVKALVSGGQQLSLAKDGYTVCKEVSFSHPTAVVITRAVDALYKTVGDGSITFMLISTDAFVRAYQLYCDGTSLPLMVNSLHLAHQDIMSFLQKQIVPLTDDLLRELAVCSLRTKGAHYEYLADAIIQALVSMSKAKALDADMVEVIRMEGGDVTDSVFVDGLVLDHSGRHYRMPKRLDNVCVMIANMSLEYEKPEINAEFCYSSPQQRERLAETERDFILEKARVIATFAEELKKEGRSLLLINEKGIDPHSLEVLSDAGVLALRRAKRRNLERLVQMCGGKIITQASQVSRDAVGYCRKVTVHTIGENKFTFVEGTPSKGACTILVRGFSDSDRTVKAVKSTLQSLFLAVTTRACFKGGIYLYKKMQDYLIEKMKSVNNTDTYGYKIMAGVCETLIKTLIKNSGQDVHSTLARLSAGEKVGDDVTENVKVVGTVFNSAIVTVITLLMCDEIIKAGKPIKDDKLEKQ